MIHFHFLLETANVALQCRPASQWLLASTEGSMEHAPCSSPGQVHHNEEAARALLIIVNSAAKDTDWGGEITRQSSACVMLLVDR